MRRICSTFSKEFEVVLVGRLLPNSKPLGIEKFKQVRLVCRFNQGVLFYLEFQVRLFLFLMKNQSEWIGAADTDTLMGAGLAKILGQRKLLFDSHEYFTEVPELLNKPIIRAIWNQVEEAFVPLTDVRMTVGPLLADLFSKKFGLHFFSIRNVPELRPEMNTEVEIQKEFTILYQGALNTGRCLEQLIEAVEGLPVKVWIAGEGDLSKSLRTRVEKKKLNQQVEFLGYVKPDELKRITPQCQLGFNVLEPLGLSYRYSLANKFFDYIHAGLPQLCSDFEEYSALNESYQVALLSKPDSNSIRLAIQFALSNSDLLLGLSKNCKKAIEDLNWNAESKQLEALMTKFH